ncbi:hypothetical protein B0O99DRAFT_597100 [Bisporella sp. PMI_857]|nr:hypothetical protein B0O99DRAFT_597100 [Bisporella sp. PMI_857]
MSQELATSSSVKDVLESGFTILHEGQSPKADIVFIHGLQGHPRNTWTSSNKGTGWKAKENYGTAARLSSLLKILSPDEENNDKQQVKQPTNIFWPQDLLAPDFENTRILTYGYDSRVSNFFSGSANQNGILQHGRDLLQSLADRRRKADRTRPLIFVAHSLGGIILKEALCRARSEKDEDEEYRDVYLSTRAIIFFGTPHRGGGASYVDWGIIATNVAIAVGFDANNRIVRDMEADSEQLERLREGFQKVLDDERIYAHTFQESKGYKGVRGLKGRVVPPVSSGLEHKCEKKGSINSNHIEMCRFGARVDPGYIKFTDVLSKILDDLSKLSKQQNEEEMAASSKKKFSIDRMTSSSMLIQIRTTGFGSQSLNSGTYHSSTLMKYALNHDNTSEALRNPDASIRQIKAGFFFHSRGQPNQKSFTGLLHSILYQIIDSVPEVETAILPIYCQLHPDVIKREWTMSSLRRALEVVKTQSETPLEVCLFIDALDEYDGKHLEMAQFIEGLTHKQEFTKVKICLSSRTEPIFTRFFGTCPGFKIDDYTASDILHYVCSNLALVEDAAPQQTIEVRPPTIKSITEYIADHAHGVFLWVSIVVADVTERLLNGDDPIDVEKTLRETPTTGLGPLYRHILEKRIPHDQCLQAYKMLEIARCSSSTPLEDFCLFFDIADSPTASVPDYMVGEQKDGKSNERLQSRLERMLSQLQSRCRGLLVVKTKTETSGTTKFVELLHGTLREYLNDQKNLEDLFVAEPKPAQNGYVYLMQGFLSLTDQHYIPNSPGMDHSLLFGEWARKAEESVGDLANPILQAFGRRKQLLEHWNHSIERLDYGRAGVNTIEEFATVYNLYYFMKQRINEGFLCPKPSPVDRIPLLHHALRDNRALRLSQNTDPRVVKLLLEAGADPNETRGAHFPLLLATFTSNLGEIKNPNLEILELLLRYGASADSEFAFRVAHPLALLNKRDRSQKRQRTHLLHIAAERRNIEMVDLLFLYGASPNLRNLEGKTPLSIAALSLREKPGQTGNNMVNKLLDHGALFTKESEPLLGELRQGLWYDDRWYLSKYHS